VHAYLSNSDYARWALLITLEVCLVCIVVRRQIYRRYPAFATYAALLCGQSWLLLFVSLWGSTDQYFVTYWTAEALTASVVLCVVMELVIEVCLPGRLTSDSQMRIFIVICLTSALVSAVATQHNVPSTRLAILSTLIAVEKAFGYATVSFLTCLLVFSCFTGLTWPQPSAAIAAGIILRTALSAIIDVEAKYFLGPLRSYLVLISTFGSAAGIGIWLAALWRLQTFRSAELESQIRSALHTAETLHRTFSVRRSWH